MLPFEVYRGLVLRKYLLYGSYTSKGIQGLVNVGGTSRIEAAKTSLASAGGFSLGPNKGKKALTLKTLPETDHTSHQGLVAKQSGFSLHAGVTVAGGERDKIEKLCRYIARPAVALERLSLSAGGNVS